MADDRTVSLTNGPPETVLPPAPDAARTGLAAALVGPRGQRKAKLAEITAHHPTFLDGWAALAEEAGLAGDLAAAVESYAYARVGYHRGLDSLRSAGWKGSGYVRWRHEANQGFLRALEALRAAASAIGEAAEEQRCAMFLRQLEPDWERIAPHGPPPR